MKSHWMRNQYGSAWFILSAGQQMRCDEQVTQQRVNITYRLHTLSEVILVEVIILEFLST